MKILFEGVELTFDPKDCFTITVNDKTMTFNPSGKTSELPSNETSLVSVSPIGIYPFVEPVEPEGSIVADADDSTQDDFYYYKFRFLTQPTNKIPVIKLFRLVFGVDLKEAKELTEGRTIFLCSSSMQNTYFYKELTRLTKKNTFELMIIQPENQKFFPVIN